MAGEPDKDVELLARLRTGDEAAFGELVDRHHATMVRVALTFVPNRAVAEEVAQETWLGVVRGVGRFEGRSSLRTWLFRILVNRARSAGERERRTVAIAPDEPAVDPSRFDGGGHWTDPPRPWTEDVENRLDAAGTRARLQAAIDGLPDAQRQVITLRDVEGLPAAEVCNLLGVSEGNQRVLLHRARSRVRGALERELGEA